jgi:hypothetical protein
MSKYEEMRDAADTARKNWSQNRDRCWGYISTLVNGLIAYCEIPEPLDRITFLKWNEATGERRAYREAEDGMRYTLPGATVFDREDGYWHLGVCVTLSPPGTLPSQWVSFALCVTEHEGKPMVKIGIPGKPRQIDLNDPRQCNEFYESIVDNIKSSFSDSRKSDSKRIGFVVSS